MNVKSKLKVLLRLFSGYIVRSFLFGLVLLKLRNNFRDGSKSFSSTPTSPLSARGI